MFRAPFPHRGVVAAHASCKSRNVMLLVGVSLLAISCAPHRHIQARRFVPPPQKPFVLPTVPELPVFVRVYDDAERVCSSNCMIWFPAELSAVVGFRMPDLPPPAPPRRPPVVAAPRPAPPPVAVESPASPRLGQIFTAEQLRDYNRAFDDSLARVRMILAVAAGRKLTPQQTGIVARIRTFMMQAEQARQQDLVTAVGLARRADVLAQDLSASLQ